MQSDYPLYEEMLRRGSRGRWFWRAGVWLCIGLVLMVWPAVFFFKLGRTGLAYPVALLALAALAALGSFLRRVSYRIALGEGIDITRYFEKPADGKR